MWVFQGPSAGWICWYFNSIFLRVSLAGKGHEGRISTLCQGKVPDRKGPDRRTLLYIVYSLGQTAARKLESWKLGGGLSPGRLMPVYSLTGRNLAVGAVGLPRYLLLSCGPEIGLMVRDSERSVCWGLPPRSPLALDLANGGHCPVTQQTPISNASWKKPTK